MLLLLLRTNVLGLYYHRGGPMDECIALGGQQFRMDSFSKQAEGFLGFYDWLRVDSTTIVGVGISFFADLPYTSMLLERPYASGYFEHRYVTLMFAEGVVDEQLSGDQDFTDNYVYVSDSGDLVMTFAVDHLSREELGSLMRYCEVLHWDGATEDEAEAK